MADNRKYYYLKLKDDFFDTDAMIVLESMPDGYKYSNILLKLYLRSLKNEGKLMFNNRIPYNPTVLAQVTRHSVGDVERALQIFTELDLIEKLDNGAIYISDIQNFIGTSSTEADRKREYRERIENEKQLQIGQVSGQMSGHKSGRVSPESPDKSTPEKEIEKELDIELEREQEKKEKSSALFEKWWKIYPKKTGPKKNIEKKFEKAIKKVGEEQFFAATEIYLKTQDQVQYICAPEVFLNQERYSKDNMETYQKVVDEKNRKQNNSFGNPENHDGWQLNKDLLERREKERQADIEQGKLPF